VAARLVSILGPPAAGKTTLAEHLAAALGARVLYEDYAGNPFLPAAYAGEAAARLPAQVCYLVSRVRQLALPAWPDEGLAVSDYAFCQDALYASLQLSQAELALYRRLAEPLAGQVKPPDLLVHLDAAPATLLRRIARRGRAFEQGLTGDFLQRLRRRYDELVAAQTCPVVRADGEASDLRQPAARDELLGRIREVLWT